MFQQTGGRRNERTNEMEGTKMRVKEGRKGQQKEEKTTAGE